MLSQIIKQKKKELQTLPEGTLVRKNGCYYHRLDGKEKGISKNKYLICGLARRRYLQEEILLLEKQQELSDWYQAQYPSISPSQLITSLPPSYQNLPRSYFLGIPDDNSSSQNPYMKEQLTYLTNGGILMRSKSEVLIANELESRGIRYQYEPHLILGSSIIYPDFVLDQPLDQSIVIWEHFGLLDKDSYRSRTQEKLSQYSRHGFFPFKNLICTYEEDIRDRQKIGQILDFMHLS